MAEPQEGPIDNETFKGLTDSLKEISCTLITAGLASMNTSYLVLGNSISLALAAVDIGQDAELALLKELTPFTLYLKGKIDSGELKGVTARHVNDPDISDLLNGTGVSVSQVPKK